MLLQVHPVQRCELSCHLLTCHIAQKGYVKVGRLYRRRTGEVLGQILGELQINLPENPIDYLSRKPLGGGC